jgi:hypothetical protein
MFPLLLVTTSKRVVDGYIKKIVKEKAIKSTHINLIQPITSIISIDQVREIINLAQRVSELTLIAVYEFDTAKRETQNAFLKTLEEKNNNIQFILQISRESAILPTIISRSKIIKLTSTKKPEVEISLSALINELSMDNYNDMTKEKAIVFCDAWLSNFQQGLRDLPAVKIRNVVTELINVRELIMKNNLNPQLAIDHLILHVKHVI